jgi:TRAP transporter TAXI family solute receptor
MSRALHNFFLSIREMLVSVGPLALVGAGLLALAYMWLDPNPPHRVTLATGPAQSAYDEFGKRYARMLALEGIEVELLSSAGSSDNLKLLREGRADLGFVQGGSGQAGAAEEETLHSLGSLFVEPVWLFYRTDSARKQNAGATLASLTQLKGLRVNVGTPGSGVPSLMDKLLEVNRIDPKTLWLSQMEQTPATVAFLNGELDAIVFASAPEALMVQMLLQTPGVKLMDFAQSEAYARRFAFLTPVLLPRGVVDLAGNLPAQDVRLVASTTTLLTPEGTHPALVQLFSQAAARLHGGAGWFSRAREFPKPGDGEFALAAEAERNLRNGVPLLQRYLPFWLANLVERMWLALGIILALLLPLSRIVPPLYSFRIRSRVFRWYGRLRDIEDRSRETSDTAPLLAELDALRERVGQVNVPLSYADELYALRSHIDQVRSKLQGGP